MTDRHAGYLVVLAKDVREDDAEEGVLNALRMVKGVLSVTPVPASVEVAIAEQRATWRLRDKILDVFKT